jgi:hypothetical protein
VAERTPEQDLALAAVNVITSLSEANYRSLRNPRRHTDPKVHLERMVKLVDAVEALYPGWLDRIYADRKARS